MAGVNLDEDSIDEILYLARANEASELEAFLSQLATTTKQSRADLVAAAVDPYSKNSALHYAAANGHIDIIKLILSQAGEQPSTAAPGLINAVNDAGNTPLHWAALNGHLECVKCLIEFGADVTIINQAGHDAVFEAEINDKKEVVDWLLGEVEELEKGVGGSNDVPGQAGEGSGMDMGDDAAKDDSNGPDEAGGVEGVRRQMEGLKAKEGSSQAG